MSDFSWRKYAEMIYGINKSKKLAKEMMKEFSKGGSVYLDAYTPEEIKQAQEIYEKNKKEKK
tara:strand:+ start:284 stop:469 length:186 start_codon:yes stop_codon:yes gene_type:complete